MNMASNRDLVIVQEDELEYQGKIGAGAFSKVYKAIWRGRGGGITVAVKKIKTLTADNTKKAKIFREVEILHRLNFAYIVQVFGCCLTKDSLLIVLEFFPDDLYKLLHSDAVLMWPARLKLALQAARAVNFLHSAFPPIIHRDIKSSNFLCQARFADIKLTDFGLAKILKQGAPATLNVLGTCGWNAPETMKTHPLWTPKADVYALGMTLWEIASRQVPFEGESPLAVMREVCDKKLRPKIPDDCPQGFADIIRRCWVPDPSQRPNAEEVIHLLEELSVRLGETGPRELPPRKPNLFYNVRFSDLRHAVPSECCVKLTRCPSFPGAKELCPQVPEEVWIITIKRSELYKHPLGSPTYDAALFDRVEDYFQKFYKPRDPSLHVRLDSVDVICNKEVERRFKDSEAQMHSRYKGLFEFKDKGQSKWQQHYLNALFESENLTYDRNSNPISVWHGTDSKNLDGIYWYGLLNLSTTDPGYYGKGIYCTQYPEYGEYYIEQQQANNKGGKFSLVLCWALLGRPYAATQVSVGAPRQPNYSSHFSIVTKKPVHQECCATTEDFKLLEGINNFFPITSTKEQAQGDEIVLFDSSHILPRYVVHYTLTTGETPQPPVPAKPLKVPPQNKQLFPGTGRSITPEPTSSSVPSAQPLRPRSTSYQSNATNNNNNNVPPSKIAATTGIPNLQTKLPANPTNAVNTPGNLFVTALSVFNKPAPNLSANEKRASESARKPPNLKLPVSPRPYSVIATKTPPGQASPSSIASPPLPSPTARSPPVLPARSPSPASTNKTSTPIPIARGLPATPVRHIDVPSPNYLHPHFNSPKASPPTLTRTPSPKPGARGSAAYSTGPFGPNLSGGPTPPPVSTIPVPAPIKSDSPSPKASDTLRKQNSMTITRAIAIENQIEKMLSDNSGKPEEINKAIEKLFLEYNRQLDLEALEQVKSKLEANNDEKPELDLISIFLTTKDGIRKLPHFHFSKFAKRNCAGLTLEEMRAIRSCLPEFEPSSPQQKWREILNQKIAEVSGGMEILKDRVQTIKNFCESLSELHKMLHDSVASSKLETNCGVIVDRLREFARENTKFKTLTNRATALRIQVAEAVRVPAQKKEAHAKATQLVKDAIESVRQVFEYIQ